MKKTIFILFSLTIIILLLQGSNANIFASTVDPVELSISDNSFTNNKDLPNIIVALLGSKLWEIGEGKSGAINSSIVTAYNHQSLFSGIACSPNFKATFIDDDNFIIEGQFFYSSPTGVYGLIKGHDGNYYVVHPNFIKLFRPQTVCYGLPNADFDIHYCTDNTNNPYDVQKFYNTCTETETILYDKYASLCAVSDLKLIPIGNCPVDNPIFTLKQVPK